MLKKIILIIMMGVQACYSSITSGEIKPTDSDRSGVVFATVYTNCAWGYTCNGSFVDTNGDVYTFDMSNTEYSDIKLVRKISYTYVNDEPIRQIDSSLVKEAASYIDGIKDDTSSEKSSELCDMGQCTLYAIDESGNLTELYSYGDVRVTRSDKNITKIVKLMDKAEFYNSEE